MNSQEKISSEQSDDQPSSVEDSPASLIALQENVRHLVMSVILQENSKESFGRLNPDGSLLRMSQGSVQASLDGSLQNSCMTFPRWGILSGGVVGELPILELVIEENGSLSLPTLMANNLECEGKEYCGTRHALKLTQAISMIPTCTSRDYKDTGNLENVQTKSLLPRVLGKNHGLKLQPAFAEWMQGFPIGWTDLKD